MKISFKKGFTLAEIMIVLTIIGILAGILLPIANNARPDEKIMKFKKANTTLLNVIRELVTSDKYFADGDLGIKANGNRSLDGTATGDYSFFCNAFADVVSAKKTNCIDLDNISNTTHFYITDFGGFKEQNGEDLRDLFDAVCAGNFPTYNKCDANITTTDGVTYILKGACDPFGVVFEPTESESLRGKRIYTNAETGVANVDTIFMKRYKIMCIDVDKLNSGEAPFGYGLRVDGKLVPGNRAKDWLKKNLQKGKNE